MLTINILQMIITNVFNRFRKSLLYVSCSKNKMSFYNFQNAFINKRNMVYLLKTISSNSSDIKTDESISIMGNEFSFHEFIDVYSHGTAKFEIQQDEFRSYKILFYRKQVDGSNVISQLHLYNSELLYAQVSFDYLDLDDNYRKSIISELSRKYSLNDNILKGKNISLKDPHNSKLKIIDNGKIILKYVSGNRELLGKFYDEASMEKDYTLEENRIQSVIANFI